jgi:hypothetical protein
VVGHDVLTDRGGETLAQPGPSPLAAPGVGHDLPATP